MKQVEYEQALQALVNGNPFDAEQRLSRAVPELGALGGNDLAVRAAQHLLRLLLDGGRFTEALQVLGALLELESLGEQARAQYLATRANIYVSMGDTTKALREMDAALVLTPSDERMCATRATWRSAQAGNPESALSEMSVWADVLPRGRHLGRVERPMISQENPRRIRVAYVSGDFRNHAVRHFIEPILRHHDQAQFEIHVFMTLAEDVLTASFKHWVDSWHDASAWDDDQLFAEIQSLGIDILVDLSGHTEGARLGVFARRAAPVQVTWFGYMGTLGLPEIDWRFSDARVTPAQDEAWHVEKIWRLSSVYAYQPPVTQTQPQIRPPMADNGYVTMVCLNHSRKLSDASLALWAKLLRVNPKSGLILISAEKSTEYAPDSLNERLEVAGMPMGQVTVVPRLSAEAFMSLSRVADFALDTFPVSGGTTTLLAMSMGLPLLALDREGAGPMETLSARLLQHAGLTGGVAQTEAEYLTKAIEWSNTPQLLTSLRADLPERLRNAPFMRHEAITREVEAAYRAMLAARFSAAFEGEKQP